MRREFVAIARRQATYAFLLALGTNCRVSAQASDPAKLFQEAVSAQQRGDDAKAVSGYRELLRTHPQSIAARMNLGTTLAHMKRFREAIEQYRLILKADPKNHPAHLNLAMAYEQTGNVTEAILELEQLHREDGADTQTSMLLADAYGQTGRDAEAVALLAPLESARPEDINLQWILGLALIHEGHLEEGVRRVETVAARAANADAYLLAAQTRLNMSQFDLARRNAESAKQLNPNLTGLSTTAGMILEQSGDYDGAEAALLQALSADANDFNAHYYLGAIYYFKRNMEKARVHLAQALQLQPTSGQARYEMALVARAEGHNEAALKDLELVVHQTPDWLEPHVELVALYYRLHRTEDGAREKQLVDRMMAAQQKAQAESAR